MRPTLVASIAPALLLLAAAPAAARDGGPPRFDGIDYGSPAAHLALSPHMGDAARIQALARQLAGETPRATLAAFSQWIHRNLKADPAAASTWMDLATMQQRKTVGGQAGRAALLGTLARAAGIPTVWVETVDLAWIEGLRAGRTGVEQHRGHVFLEVHLDGRWWLLDPDTLMLHDGWSETERRYPGERYAFEKGDDPYDMVLSNREAEWRAETVAWFTALPATELPWGVAEDLLAPWRLYVAGDRRMAGFVNQTAERLGYRPTLVFDADPERALAAARGHVLVVTTKGTEPALPRAAWAAWLPPGAEKVAAGELPAEGFLSHRLADGTFVVLVTGQEFADVQLQVVQALRAR
jgi:hypothetical protein